MDTFFKRENINNELTQILDENPDAPIRDILLRSELTLSIRYECPQLISYITNPEHLKELLKLVLTHELDNLDDNDKLKRASMLCLSTISKQIQEKLLDSAVFIEALQSCLRNDLYKDFQICGHFQRIVELYVQHTNGGFLQHFPDLCAYLIQHSNVLGLRSLLLKLLTDFSEAFEEDDEYQKITIDITKAAKSENAYFIVGLIRNIIKEKKTLMSAYRNETVLKNLLEATINPPNISHRSLFLAECFGIIENIINEYPGSKDIIKDYEPQFKFDKDDVSPGTVASLKVFKSNTTVMFPHFFDVPGVTFLNTILMANIKELNDYELMDFLGNSNVIDQICMMFPTNLINGHLIDLANYINNKNFNIPAVQSITWLAISGDKLKQALNYREIYDKKEPKKIETKKNSIPSFTSFNNKFNGGSIVDLASECTSTTCGFTNTLSKFGLSSVIDEDEEETPSLSLTSLMEINEDSSESKSSAKSLNPGELSLGSLLGETSSSASSAKTYSGIPTGSGLNKSGHSFTIPTVYQAEVSVLPMFC